jgi:response regulator RpfG family c-di-GMP phosphodiesterase
MNEEEARKEITDNAGIEFDPAVVIAFLSLGDLAELKSFARTEEELAAVEPSHDEWKLFSSFMK